MISVIIPCLNESDEVLNRTIKSIRDTSDVEIIVVDDCSIVKPKIEDQKVIFHRNNFRIGTGQTRHYAACLSNHKWLLSIDAHMQFVPGWYETFLKYENNTNEQTVYCATCLGLNEQNQDITKHRGKYHGANLCLYSEKQNQILEGKWCREKHENNYEISCLMGACYFIQKDFFFKIRGLQDLKSWGSLEPTLSIKIWLSGGEIRLLKDIQIGHIFKKKTPYTSPTPHLLYNKLRIILSCFPEDLQIKLINKIPDNADKKEAFNLIVKDINVINEHKRYYQSIFKYDIYWLCNKFNIEIPE